MNVQPQLVLLQKTLLNVEGLGRDLYPDLDLWVTAKPFFEKWTKDNRSISSLIKKLSKSSPKFINEITEFPETLSMIKDKLNNDSQQKELESLKSKIKRSQLKNMILFIILFLMILIEITQ